MYLWQIRFETLAANNDKLNYIRERNELLTQANDIQQKERSETTNKRFASTFACSYATLTTYTNDRLQRWITMALRAINYDPNLAGGQRTIRAITILPPSTNEHRVSENRPPDNRPPDNPPDNRPRNPATRTHDNRTPETNQPLPGGAT